MINGLSIESNKKEVLLETSINHELKFDEHVNYLCRNPLFSSALLWMLTKRGV